jgi:pyroglutamyl-peptidase
VERLAVNVATGLDNAGEQRDESNYVFYGFLHYLATAWAGEPPAAGFIHMPYLPEQAIGKKPIPPSLSEADIGRGVRAALRATAEAVRGG